MGKKIDYKEDDLAIQDTLSMTVPERLQLIAALIVDKISEQQNDTKTKPNEPEATL